MRYFVPVVLSAIVAGCAMAPTPPTAFDQRAQTRYAQLIGDKVPGPPRSCLPSYRSHDMAVIDDRTIVFRESPGRVWVMRPQNDCNLLSAGRFALITRSSTSQLCRGEIAQVADPSNGVAVGSCVIGDFVPFTRPGA